MSQTDTADWFELSTPTDVVHDAVLAWQRGRDGLVLALRQLSGTTYRVETYPENYHDDGQPIDDVATIHDTTYDGTAARARARTAMQELDA